MDVQSRFPTRNLTVLAQDPSVLIDGKAVTCTVPVPCESLAPGPKGHRIHVIDYDSTRNRFHAPFAMNPQKDRYAGASDPAALVADRNFHAQNVYGHVATTLVQFEAALGRHVSWSFASRVHHLKVAPHAFVDANAFYSRADEALVFGYFPIDPAGRNRRPGDFVFSCLSADVVVHETTHALLDGLRSELMRPSTPDQPAFHEGFADIVALLSALSREALLKDALPRTTMRGKQLIETKFLRPGPLRKSMFLEVAEQFGKALAKQGAIARRSQALRCSALLDPKKTNYGSLLRGDAEPHALGEVLVAAFMNAFVEIWCARSQKLDPTHSGYADLDRAAADGARAATDLLHMAIRAIDYLPPTNMTFPDFLSALLTSDRELFPGDGEFDYRAHLLKNFADYGIHPVTREGYWQPPDLKQRAKLAYGFSGYAEMTWDREASMRFIWENRAALGIETDAITKVNFVRPCVRTGPSGFLLRETVVEYFQLLDLTAADLKAYRLRRPEGMALSTPVRLMGGGTLVFDDYGQLKFHIGTGVLSERQNDRIESMWTHGAMTSSLRPIEDIHRMRNLGSL